MSRNIFLTKTTTKLYLNSQLDEIDKKKAPIMTEQKVIHRSLILNRTEMNSRKIRKKRSKQKCNNNEFSKLTNRFLDRMDLATSDSNNSNSLFKSCGLRSISKRMHDQVFCRNNWMKHIRWMRVILNRRFSTRRRTKCSRWYPTWRESC